MPHYHELKLERACHHLSELEEGVDAWLDDQLKSTEVLQDPRDSDFVVLWVTVDKSPDDTFGLLIGDCVHNLRSALDVLAFALAEQHSGVPLPEDVAKKSQFPIFGDEGRNGAPGRGPSMFRTNGLPCIRGVHPRAQAIIESVQPYQLGATFREHPLWLLREMSNIDKHRLIHTTTSYTGHFLVRPRPDGRYVIADPEEWTHYRGEVAGKMAVARLKAWPVGSPRGKYLDHPVDFGARLQVILKDVAATMTDGQRSACELLGEIHEFIRADVITPLSEFLP